MRPSRFPLPVLFLVLLAAASRPDAAPLRVLASSADGLSLELRLSPSPSLADLDQPGYPRLDQPGQPALPFGAELVAAPPGAQVQVEVQAEHYREFGGVSLAPNPGGPPAEADAFFPAERASAAYLGRLRGVPAHRLLLYPFSYNPARRTLRVYDRLQIRLRFAGGPSSRDRAAAGPADLYGVFLNPAQARSWSRPEPAPRPATREWYDATVPWVKIQVEEDGLFRLDPAWFDSLGVDPTAIDPRTFQLFYLGQEQALYGRGEEDGRFDPDDCLLFWGRFRREEDRDFESLYGRTNTYWLTWGRQPGQRFAARSGALTHGYPSSHSFWSTAHFEQDLYYDALPSAPDNSRDHWFWEQPVKVNEPGRFGSRTFTRPLESPDTSQEYTARIRLALHGFTDMAHHTVVKLNRNLVDDRVWGKQDSGQVELAIARDIPSSYLESTNQVLLQVSADQAEQDWVLFDWFEIDCLRLYRAYAGRLAWTEPPSAGRRIAVPGFSGPQVELFDLANEVRFTDLQVDSLGGSWVLSFEDRSDTPAAYAAADSAHVRRPRGSLDTPSSWRSPDRGADYLIITHPDYLDAVQPLAEHRRAAGLRVEVVSTEDLYDEFSYGLFTPQALREFLVYAYHNWERPPAYVLLAGADHYDYRNILGSPRIGFVPTLYYQSRGRGTAASDFLYSLVDGDDLLPDLAVGRLAADTPDSLRQVVDKIIRYDQEPAPGPWRRRVIYLASFHEEGQFARFDDSLATRYTEPAGLESVKLYNPDETPIPNPSGKEFLDALNAGALLVNFNGHGDSGSIRSYFSLRYEDWDYLSQVRNGPRLPLVLALACLNGQFVDPKLKSLAEVFTAKPDGGAIAYVSASAKSFPGENDWLSDRLYAQFFEQGHLEFGPALDAAKVQVLAAHPSYETAALTMQLMGDPAQELALPRYPDYAPANLRLAPAQVYSRATARVEAELRNQARLGPDSLDVLLLGRSLEAAQPETLYYGRRPPFAGAQGLSVDWQVGQRRGPYRLELILDPEDRVREIDEQNNRLDLDLDILEPALPALVFPAANAVLSPQDLSLEALAPLEGGPFACEFALSPDPDFPDSSTALSPEVPAAAGLAAHRPEGLSPGRPYFWRARLRAGGAPGAWTPVRSFSLAAVSDPLPGWRQAGVQFSSGQLQDLAVDPAARLALPSGSLPPRPSGPTREDGFTVRGLKGAGVLCTDGTYLYAKRWFNDDSTVYPGTDFFTRIGTGFNGKGRDANYGVLADSTTPGISATYYPDGYIYSECGRAFALERISVATGHLDTVLVPDGLLEWHSGQVRDGHALITSDGRYVYNAAMSAGEGSHTAWRVRVFDPTQAWAVVREFTSPPTDNGFTFLWTDGILADGERLYFVEYGEQRRIRMVDARDGRFLDEWTSDQDTTRIITGQYDWVNNKVWLGDLQGSAVYRYTGVGQVRRGQFLSEPAGPARSWQRLRIAGQVPAEGRLQVALLAQDPQSQAWTPLPDFADLPLDADVDLGRIDAREHPRLRLQARLEGRPGSSGLEAWELDFAPLPSLQVARAAASLDSGGVQVQVWVRNLAAIPAPQARLLLERSDQPAPVAELALEPLGRGQTRLVQFDSLALPPAGVGLFARLVGPYPDAEPADDRREIPLLFAGRAQATFRTWPEGRLFLSGDPLRPDQGLLVQAPEVAGGHLALAVDGQPVQPDSLLASSWDSPGQGVLFRPRLAPGLHRLQTHLFSGAQEIGFQEIRFLLTDELRLVQSLVYPHPVQEHSSFTYVLSREASVSVEIYALSGRLVRRLGPVSQAAGFQQIDWDGRDSSGQTLAGGTYLYRIAAVSADGHQAQFRGPVVVVR